jgi:uncharacterized protein YfaA (DUF2138 family)
MLRYYTALPYAGLPVAADVSARDLTPVQATASEQSVAETAPRTTPPSLERDLQIVAAIAAQTGAIARACFLPQSSKKVLPIARQSSLVLGANQTWLIL